MADSTQIRRHLARIEGWLHRQAEAGDLIDQVTDEWSRNLLMAAADAVSERDAAVARVADLEAERDAAAAPVIIEGETWLPVTILLPDYGIAEFAEGGEERVRMWGLTVPKAIVDGCRSRLAGAPSTPAPTEETNDG